MHNTDTPVTSSTLFNSYKLRTISTGPSDVEGISVSARTSAPRAGSDGSGGLGDLSWAGLSWVLEGIGGFGGFGPKVAQDGFFRRVLSRVEAFWGGL